MWESAQKDVDENESPIAFYSHELRWAHLNYTVTENECLAAVKAVCVYRTLTHHTHHRIKNVISKQNIGRGNIS